MECELFDFFVVNAFISASIQDRRLDFSLRLQRKYDSLHKRFRDYSQLKYFLFNEC